MHSEPRATHDLTATGRGPMLRRLFGRRQEPEVRREATVVAIASGKGGTGKSFLASNLAVLLARRGHRLTLVDCDFGMGNAHLLLGAKPARSVQHVLAGQATIGEVLVPTEYGFDLLPAGSGVRQLADLDANDLAVLGDALGDLATRRDLLLLDTAAGMAPAVLASLMTAHHVVLVTQADLAALTDAYALIKCLRALGTPQEFHVVVNRVTRPGIGDRTFARLAEVSERYCQCPLHYLGEVPEDPAVGLRRLGQSPLAAGDPKCATSLALEDVAEGVVRLSGAGRQRETLLNDRLASRLGRSSARIR